MTPVALALFFAALIADHSHHLRGTGAEARALRHRDTSPFLLSPPEPVVASPNQADHASQQASSFPNDPVSTPSPHSAKTQESPSTTPTAHSTQSTTTSATLSTQITSSLTSTTTSSPTSAPSPDPTPSTSSSSERTVWDKLGVIKYLIPVFVLLIISTCGWLYSKWYNSRGQREAKARLGRRYDPPPPPPRVMRQEGRLGGADNVYREIGRYGGRGQSSGEESNWVWRDGAWKPIGRGLSYEDGATPLGDWEGLDHPAAGRRASSPTKDDFGSPSAEDGREEGMGIFLAGGGGQGKASLRAAGQKIKSTFDMWRSARRRGEPIESFRVDYASQYQPLEDVDITESPFVPPAGTTWGTIKLTNRPSRSAMRPAGPTSMAMPPTPEWIRGGASPSPQLMSSSIQANSVYQPPRQASHLRIPSDSSRMSGSSGLMSALSQTPSSTPTDSALGFTKKDHPPETPKSKRVGGNRAFSPGETPKGKGHKVDDNSLTPKRTVRIVGSAQSIFVPGEGSPTPKKLTPTTNAVRHPNKEAGVKRGLTRSPARVFIASPKSTQERSPRSAISGWPTEQQARTVRKEAKAMSQVDDILRTSWSDRLLASPDAHASIDGVMARSVDDMFSPSRRNTGSRSTAKKLADAEKSLRGSPGRVSPGVEQAARLTSPDEGMERRMARLKSVEL